MKILLSPAKNLATDKKINCNRSSLPLFSDKTEYLVSKLKLFSISDLKKQMHLSDNLATLNHTRYQNWETPLQKNDSVQPAIAQFDGAAFKGFDASSLTIKEMENAQKDLRILSGLYGILRPLDLMYPYRLEMGTKWNIDRTAKSLYHFWKETLTLALKNETVEDEVIINLASTEYFKAIDTKMLNRRIITPVFKEERGGKFKTIMAYAKKARGTMARAIIIQQDANPKALQTYSINGYIYNDELSSENEWVFIR